MSVTKKKFYPLEFKVSSVELAVDGERTIAQTARNLGINITTLHNWIAKYSKTPPKDKNMQINDRHRAEMVRLKKQLALVTEERDLLKKAAAYFARESQ